MYELKIKLTLYNQEEFIKLKSKIKCMFKQICSKINEQYTTVIVNPATFSMLQNSLRNNQRSFINKLQYLEIFKKISCTQEKITYLLFVYIRIG